MATSSERQCSSENGSERPGHGPIVVAARRTISVHWLCLRRQTAPASSEMGSEVSRVVYLVGLFASTLALLVTYSAAIAALPASADWVCSYDEAVETAGGNDAPGVVSYVDLTDEATNGELGAAAIAAARVHLRLGCRSCCPKRARELPRHLTSR